MNQLPEYLKFYCDASPDKEQTVDCKNVRFTVITDRLIRIEQGAFCDEATLTVISRDFSKTDFSKDIKGDILTVETESLLLKYVIDKPISADTLSIRLKNRPYTEWHFGDKPLQNLGGTVSTLDRVNGECPIDDGICSIDGYALIDDGNTPIMTKDGWFMPRQKELDLYFFGYGHDYTACVQDYCRLTGVTEMLPAYAFGNWWSRYHAYSDTEYLNLMDEFRKNDVPFSVGIVDMDWHLTGGDGRNYFDGWTGYTWNSELFPDYKAFLNGLKERNIKTALNLHPADGVRCWDNQYNAMAKALGSDVSQNKPIPFDCLDEKFLKAYFEILHFPYEEDGVNFWWMDWQQGTDYSWIHKFKPEVKDLECVSPLWMLNHMHFLALKRNGKRGMIFSRFSGFGSQRYPIGFSGDTVISWRSLQFQVYFTVTASNIGYGLWSHDIGGHMHGIKDDELNARWVQFGVFSPVFRLHSSCQDFLGREPWNYGLKEATVIKKFMQLRHKLFPYLYTMNYRNYNELIPLMRPMYHTHPESKEAYKVPNQYWFGSELIVAPITDKADHVSQMGCTQVWFPDGVWVDWFNGYIYSGNQKIEVYRPLEQMPLFLKAGGIVPMQPYVSGNNTLGKSDKLEIVIGAGDSGSFTLYEDDGESLDYQNGNFCKTEFSFDWKTNEATFEISPVIGNSELIPKRRTYTLLFRGFSKGCAFYSDGKPVSADYDCKTNTYSVLLENRSVSQKIILKVQNGEDLLHDNGDCRERVVDALTHAQCDLNEKYRIINMFDSKISKTPFDEKEWGVECNTPLSRFVMELAFEKSKHKLI